VIRKQGAQETEGEGPEKEETGRGGKRDETKTIMKS